MPNRLKILALTRYDQLGASSRMRIIQFSDILEYNNMSLCVSPLFTSVYLKKIYKNERISKSYIAYRYILRGLKFVSIKKYDLVWIEKEIYPYLPAYFEKLLNIINVKYIVDFDDAIFHNYDLSNNIFVKKILFSKIDNVMKSACLVTCGNKYLKEKALLSGSKKIEILPTVIDINKYQLLSKNNKNRLIIGWIGSPTSIVHFNLIMNSLKKISRDFDIEIRIIGAKLFDKELNINCLDWCEESEVDEINRFDIGIMPLVDSPWEKGKCGFKLIQYMACGIPVIASPVGVNKTIVQDGYNGFQASTEEEWYKAFKILGASFKLRKKLGEHGRLLVEKKYSIQAIEHKVIGIFRNAAGR